MIKAELITGNLKDNTMTFEIEGEMTLQAGKYKILKQKEFDEINRSVLELFITWYNAKTKCQRKDIISVNVVNDFLNNP